MTKVNPNAKMRILSTSTIHGSGFLEYIQEELANFLKGKEVTFIPYARPSGVSYDEYTKKVEQAFDKVNIKTIGLHTFENPIQAIQEAEALFIGGGNTFLLLKTLYEKNLIDPLKEVIYKGTPYIGSSAGSNITGQTIGTTNDMPIIYPPSFDALGILPFNLNPHYLDPDPHSTHKGETRATRIQEFHVFNPDIKVVGLREGSWLNVENGTITLKGTLNVRIFEADLEAYELSTDTIL